MVEPNYSGQLDASSQEVENSVLALGSASTWDQLHTILKLSYAIANNPGRMTRAGRAGREAYAVLEHERDILLTDTADRILEHLWAGKSFPGETEIREKTGFNWETNDYQVAEFLVLTTAFFSAKNDDEKILSKLYRLLLRRVRQIGVSKAWEEQILMAQGKDWIWVSLFEVFGEWVYESALGERDYPLEASTLFERHRQARLYPL